MPGMTSVLDTSGMMALHMHMLQDPIIRRRLLRDPAMRRMMLASLATVPEPQRVMLVGHASQGQPGGSACNATAAVGTSRRAASEARADAADESCCWCDEADEADEANEANAATVTCAMRTDDI